jgi:hypothetical protein
MEHPLARALSQLHDAARVGTGRSAALVNEAPVQKRRIRISALALTTLALAFYVGFIAMSVYRSRH